MTTQDLSVHGSGRAKNRHGHRDRLGVPLRSTSEQFLLGLGVELEHGAHDRRRTSRTTTRSLTGKIAWAHLKELPGYYTRLVAMEAEAEA